MTRVLACLPLAACATATLEAPVQPLHDAEIVSADAAGTPTFLRGTLGEHGDRDAVVRITSALGLGAATLELVDTRSDQLGTTHLRYQPALDGIVVIGGDVQLHVNAAGIIYAATRALPVDRIVPRTTGDDLVYVVTSRDRTLHLARMVEETGTRDGLPFRDRVFIDASSGDIVDRHPQIHPALARRVHDAQRMTALPGIVAMNEGDAPSADASVAAVYAHSGAAHDCFRMLFAREGIDGGTVVSSVHYGANVANAFWTGSQLVFGDGDGVDFSDLAQGYDVVVHELTHGVTQHTAGLVYANEPGALNEAFSDIMAARCEAWRGHDELTPQVWQLGEDVFTPAIAGDALRYLDDPAADGVSYDYYPERYRGLGDHGGVHINSGIANLAFRLLATGGAHPRGKTTTVVPALGIDVAGQIFYRALATYLTSTSGFEAARIATTQAALDLYGADAALAVQAAWTATGVEEAMTAVTTLTNNVAIANLAHDSGATRTYSFAVPAGSANLRFEISGGSGNADLYVRFGTPPTETGFDYAPRLAGNTELVTPASATAGTWYIRVRTLTGYSGVTLRASYEKQATGTRLDNGVARVVSGAAGSWQHFYVTFPPGATEQIVRTSGGTGDADLYASFGASNVPTLSAFHKRSAWGDNSEFVSVVAGDPTSGTWQIALYGMRAYSNVSLVASYTPDPGTYALTSGAPSPAFTGNTGSRRMFSIEVPQGAQNLRFRLAVPTGNADMFIKRGVAPTLTSYSHHGSLYQGVSTVTPTYTELPGTWYVMVRGKTSYEGATLTATFDPPTPPRELANNVPVAGLAGSYGTEHRFVIDVPQGASNLSFTTAGTGDSDVFARFGAPPTISLYDKRAASFSANETIVLPTASAGRWHVMVRGYATFSNVSLVGRYDVMQD